MASKNFISIQTQKRLLRDVADIMKNNLYINTELIFFRTKLKKEN